MKFSIGKFVVLALIVVLAIVAVNKYTSEDVETKDEENLAGLLTAGLSDKPATGTAEGTEDSEEEWDKPYSKNLVELIEKVESGENEQTEEDKEKMAGNQAADIFNDEFDTKPKHFPLVEKIALQERSRYSVVFETDNKIRFVVYAEDKYNSWINSGQHATSKITTKSGPICCATEGSYSMDINIGEGGDYYFLFDGSDIEFESDLPTKAKLKVTKTGDI
jgi:hypothetical protein